MKKSIIKRIIMLLLVLSTAGGVTIISEASETENSRVVKVGYIDYQGFIDKNASGYYTGYGIEYLKEISRYTGWSYEFVYGSWNDLMKKVENGEIDFLCHAQMTDERRQRYLYSQYSIGTEASILYVRQDDERFYYNDFEHFNGMKIAMLNESFQNGMLEEYASEKKFSYEPFLMDTEIECFDALEAGTVDGVVMGSLAKRSGYKVVCRFSSEPFYFITGRGNRVLMKSLNDALGSIAAENPYFEADLHERYYSDSSLSQSVLFTREEINFIDSIGNVNVAFIPDRTPISSFDESGRAVGISVDIMNMIAEKSGLDFIYESMPAGMSSIDFISNNPDKLIANVMSDNPNFDFSSQVLSDSYFSSNVILATRTGNVYSTNAENAQYKLAVPASYSALMTYIERNHPQFEIHTYINTDECMRAVLRGEADYVAQNINIISPMLQDPHYEGLTALPTFFMDERLSVIGARNERNIMLINIINKCIDTISEKDIDQIAVNHTVTNTYIPDFGDMLYKYRYPFTVVALLLIALAGLLIAVDISNKRHYRQMYIKNEELALATERANNASKTKSRFLTQMSHEIRTPMNAIIGLVAIAKNEILEPQKILDNLIKIEGASKLLLSIINDVLDMSAIESNKLKIAHETFDFKQMISSISNMYYLQCRQKNIKFNMRLSGITDEELIGDSLRINQILMNILSNAVKFTSSGGRIDVIISQVKRTEKQSEISFIIKDTGCGMSEDMISRVFKPFEQENASTAKKYGGSGLGLSISKDLVRLMNGSISVESTLGEGTSFTIVIPFEVPEKNSEQSNVEIRLHDIRAIIVDDDPDVCEYTSLVLKGIGIVYDVANSGEEALMMLGEAEDEGHPYNMCFIDWKMDSMNGIEVSRKIREIFDENTVIIILSAFDLNEIESEGKDAKINFFVSKPLFQSTVFDILMKISGGQAAKLTADETAYNLSGHKVLVAEDVALNMEVAIKLLNIVGVEVECAEDGEQAVRMFEASKPGSYDAVLLDIHMPVMDGYEAARRIRKSSHPEAADIPIFAMTANAFMEDVAAALAAGMNGHIAKPIDTEILYSTLKETFDKKKNL